MNRLGVTVFGILFSLSFQAFAAEPAAYYDQLFSDGKLDITLALGFEQKKDSGLGGVTNVYKQFLRDEETTVRDVDAVETAILACAECGFQAESRVKGQRVYVAKFHYGAKEIQVRVRFIYSVSGVSTQWLRKTFINALGNDDVIMYIGHARNGRGFPDFGAPSGDAGKIFTDSEFGGWLGFEKGFFSPSKYQILSIHACQTDRYFTKILRERVWEKEPSKLALLMTKEDSWFEDYPATSVALIRGLMVQLPRAGIIQSLEDAATYYQAVHAMDDERKPLFNADGFFDDAYVGKKKPKKKRPNEPWRPMPF